MKKCEILSHRQKKVCEINSLVKLLLSRNFLSKKCIFVEQCGNCGIFLPLRFYVKSKLVDLESQNLPFLHIYVDALNFDFREFLHFLKNENHQIDKFRAPKIARNGNL